MKNVVLLFSGQGAQQPGMGKDLANISTKAKLLAEQADNLLGYSLSNIMFEGTSEELTKTSKCQPALYVHGLMSLAVLREYLPNLQAVAAAGLSLGEFTAHTAAGSLPFESGLPLVAKRGEFMEQACNTTKGTMAALIGADVEQATTLANSFDIDIANFNAPGQIVISGAEEKIDNALAKIKEFGIKRAIKLNVAGAYHSRLMQLAQDLLAIELAKTNFAIPTIPVICNFSALPVTSPSEIIAMLQKQVTGSVRWEASIKYLLAQGHRTFLELGPGKIIAGMIGKIDSSAKVLQCSNIEAIEASVKELTT